MPTYKLFNFNVYPCYSLSSHPHCLEVLHSDPQVTHADQKIAFKHFNTNTRGGLILRMQTIPSTVYHLFLNGQLVNGDQINFRVFNPHPTINLSPEVTIKIGEQDSRSICFRALSAKTNLIISTPKSCLDFAPYSFILHSLEIIPDCLICKGIIEGPTGPIGFQGNPGVQLPAAATGFNGVTGGIGSIGSTGPSGATGPAGNLGFLGPFGPPSDPSALVGNTGPVGFTGSGGAIGSVGPVGSAGPVGTPGGAGTVGPAGSTGSDGPVGSPGDTGITGPQGDNGVLVNTTLGTFTGTWSRSGESPAGATFNWERVGNRVTLNMSAFSSVPSGGEVFVSPLFLVVDSGDFLLPPEIRPAAGNQGFFSIPIIVNGSPQEAIIQIGPGNLILYNSPINPSFAPSDVVDVPELTKTYYTF